MLQYNYGTGFVSCVTGHTKSGTPGHTVVTPTRLSGWDTHDRAHRNYAVLYRPPSKA